MNLRALVDKAINNIQKGTGYLGHGNDGTIYAVDEKVILKLHNGGYHGCPQKSAEHEFALGTELYQQGVQVPEYLGLFGPVSIGRIDWSGVFMERIYGLDSSILPPTLIQEAQRQFQAQKKLIDKLGYIMSSDSKRGYSHNTLFDSEQGKLFLFDLVQWKRK